MTRRVFKMEYPFYSPHPEFHPSSFLCYFIKERYFHGTLGIMTSCCILLPRTSSSEQKEAWARCEQACRGITPQDGRSKRSHYHLGCLVRKGPSIGRGGPAPAKVMGAK
jgi:hypothetical protein